MYISESNYINSTLHRTRTRSINNPGAILMPVTPSMIFQTLEYYSLGKSLEQQHPHDAGIKCYVEWC